MIKIYLCMLYLTLFLYKQFCGHLVVWQVMQLCSTSWAMAPSISHLAALAPLSSHHYLASLCHLLAVRTWGGDASEGKEETRAQWKAHKDCYWAWNNITEVHTLNYTALVLANKLASDTYTHNCRDFWVTQIYLLTSILASRPPLPPQGSDKGCCQIVEKFLSCLFINTFPWPWWKTSGGQRKMWRRIFLKNDNPGA